MTAKTATPEIPYNRTRPQLPKLDTSQVMHELAALGEPFDTLIPHRSEAMKAAHRARSHYASLPKNIEAARKADSDALLEAAKAGKPDPGRVNEMRVLREIEAAYSDAEIKTRLSNEATRAVLEAMLDGEKPLAAIDAQLDAAGEMVVKGADIVLEGLARIEGYRALREALRNTSKGKGFRMIAHGSVKPLDIAAHGQGVNATLAAEQLRVLDPKAES